MFKIAACQYQIEHLSDWKSYTHKIETLVAQAKNQQAQLLLMPEYAGIEIACNQFANDQQLFSALQPRLPTYLEFYQKLAQQYQIYIQPGTIIEAISAS